MKKLTLLFCLLACGCKDAAHPAAAAVQEQPVAKESQNVAQKESRKEAQNESPIEPGAGYVVVPWDRAEQYVDSLAFVHGQVVATHNAGSRCYLNFDEDIRNTFTATIDGQIFAEFPEAPEHWFNGKRVVVGGRIHRERGKPEIAVSTARNIFLVPPEQQDVLAMVRQRYPRVVEPDQVDRWQAPRAFDGTIRIGTYNVLNLFDQHDDPYRNDEVMKTKPRAELEKIAERIRRLDADVLALQEVENRFYLEAFVRSYLPDMGYKHIVLVEGNNHRGIDCAVVSRLPIGPVTTYSHLRFQGPDGKTYRFMRDLLRVRIEGPEDFRMDVFCVHLKSKYGGAEESEPIRQAEARKIRGLIDDLLYQDPQASLVICGDFNDVWDSASLKIIRGSGQTELSCPGVELDGQRPITYNRPPHRSMIDFILCAPAMKQRYVERSYRVIDGTVEDSGSDHNPCVATFRIR